MASPLKNASLGYMFTYSWILSLFTWNYHNTVNWLWKCKVKVAQSCPTLCDPVDYTVYGILRANTLLQGIFPTQGSNPGLPRCRWILYQLSHKGSLRILEWVAYPFSSRSSWPKNQTGVSCIAGGFFINWAIRDIPQYKIKSFFKNKI